MVWLDRDWDVYITEPPNLLATTLTPPTARTIALPSNSWYNSLIGSVIVFLNKTFL
jgi:hypothetical protein